MPPPLSLPFYFGQQHGAPCKFSPSTLSQKVGNFYYFCNSGPMFIIFSLLNSERICGASWNYNYLHSNLLSHYLAKSKCETMQLDRTGNSVQSDAQMFNYSRCSQGMLFPIVCLHRLIYHIFKMSLWHICTCMFLSRACHHQWMHYCSMLSQTFIFITERHE